MRKAAHARVRKISGSDRAPLIIDALANRTARNWSRFDNRSLSRDKYGLVRVLRKVHFAYRRWRSEQHVDIYNAKTD